MKVFLGLLSMLLIGARMAVLIVAYVVVVIAEWLERAAEWVDRKRGFAIVQVGKTERDIRKDFTEAQIAAYELHAGGDLSDLCDISGPDTVYWDLYDFELK